MPLLVLDIGSGSLTIATAASLVATRPVDIDGTSQPGFSGRPVVEVRAIGSTPGGSGNHDGLVLNGGSNTVAGLVLNHLFDAVVINSSGNRVEATSSARTLAG